MPDFRVPYRCLVPGDVAESIAALIDGERPSEVLCICPSTDTPTLSDRVVTISGNPEEQEHACRLVLSQLRRSQGAGASDEALFVLLVPSAVAPAVVGARGQRVQMLTRRSGATIEVSREVIEDLAMQSVTVVGTLDQVVAGTIGIHEVLQEIAQKGWLQPAVFELPHQLDGSVEAAAGNQFADSTSSSQGLGNRLADCANDNQNRGRMTNLPAPVILLVDMDTAGRIIGKQGRCVIELQKISGANITLLKNGSNLPGMKCGDRLIEIAADVVARRDEGVRAVLGAIAEKSSSDSTNSITILIPVRAVGYAIGKGGQTIKEIMHRLGVDIVFDQDGPPLAGARKTLIKGPPNSCMEAVLVLSAKIDELRDRLAGDASIDNGLNGARGRIQAFMRQPAGLGNQHQSPSTTDPASQWPEKTHTEKALLAGIEASGVLNHQLTMQMPRDVLECVDLGELERRSGARINVNIPRSSGTTAGHCFVTVVGQRISTSMAALYLQEKMIRGGI